MKQQRVRKLNKADETDGPILYWMSREQRVRDNWALIAAQELARERRRPLCVCFALATSFLGAPWRHYDFMLRGLREVEADLTKHNIPFYLLLGSPLETVPELVQKLKIAAVFTDFTPLRIGRKWRETVAKMVDIPFYEVDARNVVPCWVASPKMEIGARTLRPKIHKLLDQFLDDFPAVHKQDDHNLPAVAIDWDAAAKSLHVDHSIPICRDFDPGEEAARKALARFIDHIDRYDEKRNDPSVDAQSGLSPYLHFGHISAQHVVKQVLKEAGSKPGTAGFIEELVVRRELSDNFCLYRQDYDSTNCFPEWAKASLNKHLPDKRPYLYTRDEFEQARTHDPLWNAAQIEMVEHGKMHGYMRMYWAKKILEWTETAEEAMAVAIYLNDRYELDGRESNGYAGIAWSIGGVHDRPWPERPIYGVIRYMSYNGAKSKFDVDAYIKRVGAQPGQASLF